MPKAKHWPDEQPARIWPIIWIRRRLTLQSSTYTESLMGKRDRYKCEGVCALPGEISNSAMVLPASRGVGMELEKSAEAILRSPTRTEGTSLRIRGADCDCEGDGDLEMNLRWFKLTDQEMSGTHGVVCE